MVSASFSVFKLYIILVADFTFVVSNSNKLSCLKEKVFFSKCDIVALKTGPSSTKSKLDGIWDNELMLGGEGLGVIPGSEFSWAVYSFFDPSS